MYPTIFKLFWFGATLKNSLRAELGQQNNDITTTA